MSKTFRAWDVDQPLLLPPSVRDLVPAGHVAHFVRDLVRDSLDLSAVLSEYREERGQPPYHPAMMTALLLYGYSQGVYSSRALAMACEQRVDFMAVTAMQRPDFRTISDFRKRHLGALGALFGQVLGLCSEAGLVRLGHVSLDGTKIRANASRRKAMSYGGMQRRERELAGEVAQWFARAEEADAAEDAALGEERRGDELPEWVRDKQERLVRIREAMAALKAEASPGASDASVHAGDAGEVQAASSTGSERPPPASTQRNFTDPESRIMKTPEGFAQAYNAQAVVDAQSQVIVAEGVTNACSDQGQLVEMLEAVERNVGRAPRELSADSGYCSEANLREIALRGIRGYVATGRQRHGSASSTGGRSVRPGSLVERMQWRLRRAGYRSRYRLRKQTVEPVFGQIKAARGFRQFHLRGLAKVADEWRLICTVHNLLKLARSRGPATRAQAGVSSRAPFWNCNRHLRLVPPAGLTTTTASIIYQWRSTHSRPSSRGARRNNRTGS